MAIDATDLKNGTTFLQNGEPYKVIKYSLIKMGRGGAVVRVSAKNLVSGATEEKTFSSNNSVDEVNTFKKQLQFLYCEAASSAYKDSHAIFMDPQTYDQVEISLDILGDQTLFLKEGDVVNVLFWEERPLSIELPPKVELTVSETDPGVKGNSAANIYKQAVLENGLKLKVPLFINTGDKIRVDTRTSEYVERAK